jgi:hypothetical protein
MSEDEFQQLVERVRESIANPTISTDTGVEAVQKVSELAAQDEIEWAVAGGLAMHLYGSPRLTKDVDIIASDHLSLTPQHRLSFGGRTVKQKVIETAGEEAWLAMLAGFRRLFGLADGTTTEPSKYMTAINAEMPLGLL